MGWWLAGVLALFFSLQAGALDLDKEIKRQSDTAHEVLKTLGRDRGAVKPHLPSRRDLPSLDAPDSADDYHVELIPARGGHSS